MESGQLLALWVYTVVSVQVNSSYSETLLRRFVFGKLDKSDLLSGRACMLYCPALLIYFHSVLFTHYVIINVASLYLGSYADSLLCNPLKC
jgi:hypothetical protein